jgi:hypothetical protein
MSRDITLQYIQYNEAVQISQQTISSRLIAHQSFTCCSDSFDSTIVLLLWRAALPAVRIPKTNLVSRHRVGGRGRARMELFVMLPPTDIIRPYSHLVPCYPPGPLPLSQRASFDSSMPSAGGILS